MRFNIVTQILFILLASVTIAEQTIEKAKEKPERLYNKPIPKVPLLEERRDMLCKPGKYGIERQENRRL